MTNRGNRSRQPAGGTPVSKINRRQDSHNSVKDQKENVNVSFFDKLRVQDEALGFHIYTWVQRHSLVRILCEILSLSGDEAIWFGVSTVGGLMCFIARGYGSLRDMGCVEESLWDMFGTCAVCIFFESMLKMTFRRTRPTYAVQSKSYCIHGEWWSFPSGHALRAFYFPFWLSRNRFVKLIAPVIVFPRARRLIPWALAVGFSRVAKGKHYPIDVVMGSIVGSILGYIVEDQLDNVMFTVIKTVSGIYTAICFGYYVVMPLVECKKKESVISVLITMVLYTLTAIAIFINSLPSSMAHAGGQTIIGQDGVEQCRTLW